MLPKKPSMFASNLIFHAWAAHVTEMQNGNLKIPRSKEFHKLRSDVESNFIIIVTCVKPSLR